MCIRDSRLTGLPNRELFAQRLARSLHGRLTVDPPMTVCLLDLDHFKYLNDSRGHRVGDSLVVAVAQRISALLGEAFIARVGGDEFGLLVEGLSTREDTTRFGQQLLAAFEQPFDIDDIDCYVSASVGIAVGHATDRAEVVMSNACLLYTSPDGTVRVAGDQWSVLQGQGVGLRGLLANQVSVQLRHQIAGGGVVDEGATLGGHDDVLIGLPGGELEVGRHHRAVDHRIGEGDLADDRPVGGVQDPEGSLVGAAGGGGDLGHLLLAVAQEVACLLYTSRCV